MDRARRARNRRAARRRHARLRPVELQARHGATARPVRVPRPDGARALGCRAPPLGGDARRLRRRGSRACRTRSAPVARMGARHRILRGGSGADRTGGRAPGGAAPVHTPVVLRQRLDVPDRARRSADPRRGQPVRPPLRRLGSRALLQPERERPARHGRAPGRVAPLCLLSGACIARRGVGRPAEPPRRLPRARGAGDTRTDRRRSCVSGAALGTAHVRRRCGCQSRRRPRRLVRDG